MASAGFLPPVRFDKFCKGVLLGGLIGDCYGYIFEDQATVKFNVPQDLLRDTVTGLASGQLVYTDDTQMALGILNSLHFSGKLDPSNIAMHFSTNYFKDGAHRYYGGSIVAVFNKLRDSHYKDPFLPAAQQFNGGGSFGNGGAMRIAPAVLYALDMPENTFADFVVDITRITHCHPLGICGALIMAFAVRNLYRIVSGSHIPLDHSRFLDCVLELVRNVDSPIVNFKSPAWKSAFDLYKTRFDAIKKLLRYDENASVEMIVSALGNDLKAINSVPTAIYAFLRSLKPIPGINFDSIVIRCLVFSIGIGGDTDTIACMACALAGGYVGFAEGDESIIPSKILQRCEGLDVVLERAHWLSQRNHGC